MDVEAMTDLSLPQAALHALIGGSVGALAGAAYFTALWRNIALFERGPTPGALALLVGRFALLALVLLCLAKLGALALLAGAGGLLAARRFVLKRFGKIE
jgi:F1F0 ATPase subunit 2